MNFFAERGTDAGWTALVDPGVGNVTFNQLSERVRRGGGRLADVGLQDSRTVVVLGDSSVNFVVTYLACVHAGLDVLVLDSSTSRPSMTNAADRVGADALITKKRENHQELDLPVYERQTLLENNSSPEQSSAPLHKRHRLLLRTSGTTGSPKIVALNWENLRASVQASSERLETTSSDLWMSPLPVRHMGGMAPLLRFVHDQMGLLPVSYDRQTLAGLLETHPVSGLSLVPTMLRDLLDAGHESLLQQLRIILVGGAPVPTNLRQEARSRGLRIYPTYGMTETSSQIATARPRDLDHQIDTVGRPVKEITVRLEDLPDSDRTDSLGEITVSGSVVANGYEDAPPEAERKFNEQGFRTGDLGYFDEEGRLYVVGRRENFINRGGETLHPSRFRRELESHPSVEECAVIGRDSRRLGKSVAAVLVTEPTAEEDENSFRRWTEESLPSGHKIDEFHFVAEIPRTESGTVDHQQLDETLD